MACKICEKECPPQCIYIVKSDDKKPDYMGKPQFYPKIFDIDISVCMSCQICVEVCPFEAIKMDKEFELSKRERFDHLLLRKEQLSKSNEYYHKIHPVEAAAVDKNLADAAAAAEAKKKAAAEAAAKAAAAKAAAAATTEAKPSTGAAVVVACFFLNSPGECASRITALGCSRARTGARAPSKQARPGISPRDGCKLDR